VKHPLRVFSTLFLGSIFAVSAVASCTPPAQPGAVICYPTANANIVPQLNIEGAATGKNLPIKTMILYLDSKNIYEITNSNSFIYAEDNILTVGSHLLVLNAWDSDGNLYQASLTFSIQVSPNSAFSGVCSTPKTGINLCQPVDNDYYPESNIPFLATGNTAIDIMKGYVNGSQQVEDENGNYIFIGAALNPSPDGATFVVNGWNSKGNLSQATATGIRTYYDGACIGRSGCNYGVSIQEPAIFVDQTSPFSLDASVKSSPATITSMKAYLDNTVVATSSGPTILSTVTASPGTHDVTVQAWDSEGNLYKSQVTVNVQ
jgi:hypothetical protein